MSDPSLLSAHVREPEVGRLLVTCGDRPGIVAGVSRFLFEQGANIIHSNQHSTDPEGGVFFMRVEFHLSGLEQRAAEIERRFAPVGESFGMEWRFAYARRPKRLAIFASHAEHALLELVWRRRAGDLSAEIAIVVSNHQDLEETVTSWGIPYFYVPVDPARKWDAEDRQLHLCAAHGVDTIVFARYMQIASPAFLAHYPARVINIHHSFLPAFVGSNPYEAAYERGVKLIGATAHYVTHELDAGPIIEQDIQRVDHRHSPAELRRLGAYIERLVLARAVTWHVEDRILLYGNKTIVFA